MKIRADPFNTKEAEMEVVKFSAKPHLARVLVPQTIGLFALGGVFYAMLIFDMQIAFQGLSAATNYLIVAGLLVLLAAETVVNYAKYSSLRYEFFNNNVVIKKHNSEQSILYNEIPGVSFQRNPLDRLFRTVTLVLTPKFKIKFIKDENKVHFNIQKLIQQSRQLGAIDEA